MSTPVSIKLHDLISAAKAGRLGDVVERDQELSRLIRILLRPTHHHVVLVADPGTGKSSLIEALALRRHQGHFGMIEPKLYRLNTEPIMGLLVNGSSLQACIAALKSATARLTNATIVVEDIQLLATDDPTRMELTLAILQALASHPGIRLIVTTTTTAYHRFFRDDYQFGRIFEALELPPASPAAATSMTLTAVPRLEATNRQTIELAAVTQAVEFGARFGRGRALPDAAIRLLEETCVKAGLEGRDTVTAADVQAVISEREHLPIRDLAAENDDLATLEPQLQHAVVGQAQPIRTIARHLVKSQLGLGDSSKPKGSFLLLGPSGVGKTETAKALTKTVYHNPNALVRLDMSEYGEPHAAIRLIGSPPGYVGYEEGGQLTGAVQRQPHSLVLIDEIEKAHPKLFDLFLQLLDDGRLTDSQGKTVDFTETMVLATSNTAAHEITTAATAGTDIHSPEFMQTTILPLLMRTYRPEFINRFDAILIYNPLGEAQLVALAQRELAALSTRLAKLGVSFNVPDATLARMLRPTYNPLFGARPVKRLISTHFETPIADLIVRRALSGPVTINGSEPWLTGVTQ
ncbi:MAG: ATP-dependent Clp protease ATPase subunit, ATP-dependent Clp protease ATP-binding subunit ClpC [Candidatus Saccharibacteria bacterium]|nr:ATP-dependent Clp protease ATPase subunit, ATP-dependent Clp protease ATP-binding subunit ClpC [Candidatus Saccharibacteria bacterium]